MSEAGSVAEALDALSEPPDWMLLDLMLPDGSGTSLLRKVQSERIPCRVCIVTGCDYESLLGSGLSGAEHAFTKPVDVVKLMQVLRS